MLIFNIIQLLIFRGGYYVLHQQNTLQTTGHVFRFLPSCNEYTTLISLISTITLLYSYIHIYVL